METTLNIDDFECVIENYDDEEIQIYAECLELIRVYLALHPYADSDMKVVSIRMKSHDFPYNHGDVTVTLYTDGDAVPEFQYTKNLWK